MANKKGKSGGKSGGKGGKQPANQPKNKSEANPLREPQLTPQDRIDVVRPFWEAQAQSERVELLTVDLKTLKERARTVTELTRQQAVADVDGEHLDMLAMGMEPSMEEILDEGVARLKERSTWKLWTWPPDGQEFTDAEAFRQHVVDKHIREELRKYLPRDDPKLPERPAEEAFRKRMSEVFARVQQANQRHYEDMTARSASASNKERTIKNSKDGKREKSEKERDGKDKPDKDKADKEKDKDKERDQADMKEPEKDSKESDKDIDKKEDKPSELRESPVTIYRRRRHHASDAATLTRDHHIELINIMLEALEQEHEVLYQTLVLPIALYIMDVLPEETRDTNKMDLVYEDLDKLPTEDLACINEWLTEKVDALTQRLKAEPREDEEPEDEENMGDVDLWALADPQGDGLTVNSKWLQHLTERLLGEDGHPRKVKSGEDPHSNGLVLEWVYGTIVSTAEKARDGAKRPLGQYLPAAGDAHLALVRACEEQSLWDSRLQECRQLLSDLLKTRLEAQQLTKQYDIKPVPKSTKFLFLQPEDIPGEDMLPDHVCLAMLRREVLLTKAKLHYLLWERISLDRQLHTWKSQLKQGEPEFERLKRELEEVKHSHRGLDSTYRSHAEMERHRAQLADAAIEEQLEVQTAFREQGALLQTIYDNKQRTEYEKARKESEIKQLQGWSTTVEGLIKRFTDLLALQAQGASQPTPALTNGPTTTTTSSNSGDEEEGGEAASLKRSDSSDMVWESSTSPTASGSGMSAEDYMQLAKLRNHVHKDVRRQLYSDSDDKTFFDNLKNVVKGLERRMEELRVVIQHLEMQLLNVACDDPGIAVGAQLALPLLQDRLDSRAKEYASETAKMAESEIIRMELERASREAEERERKRAAKAAKKDKAKSEKEKERADKEAREAAEVARKQQEEAAKKLAEEEEKRKKQEARDAARRAEEEYLEARRRELLSDENGYWRRRMRMEEERAAAEAAVVSLTSGLNDAMLTAEALATAAAASSNNTGTNTVVSSRQGSVDISSSDNAGRSRASSQQPTTPPGSVAVKRDAPAADKPGVVGVAGKPRSASPLHADKDSRMAIDQNAKDGKRPSGPSSLIGKALDQVLASRAKAAAAAPSKEATPAGVTIASAAATAESSQSEATAPATPPTTSQEKAAAPAPSATSFSQPTVSATATSAHVTSSSAPAASKETTDFNMAAPVSVEPSTASFSSTSSTSGVTTAAVPTAHSTAGPAIYFGAVPVPVVTHHIPVSVTATSQQIQPGDAHQASTAAATPTSAPAPTPAQAEAAMPITASAPVPQQQQHAVSPAVPAAAPNTPPAVMPQHAQHMIAMSAVHSQSTANGPVPSSASPAVRHPMHVPPPLIHVQHTPGQMQQHPQAAAMHPQHAQHAQRSGAPPASPSHAHAAMTMGVRTQGQQPIMAQAHHPGMHGTAPPRMGPAVQVPVLPVQVPFHNALPTGSHAGAVVVPGPTGPMFFYTTQPTPAAAAMMANGPAASAAMQMVAAQQQYQQHLQNMMSGQHAPPVIPAVPPPPPPHPHPNSTYPGQYAGVNDNRSMLGSQSKSGEYNPSPVPSTSSDKSLNAAAKPFVPSAPKPTPVQITPPPPPMQQQQQHSQHMNGPLGHMGNVHAHVHAHLHANAPAGTSSHMLASQAGYVTNNVRNQGPPQHVAPPAQQYQQSTPGSRQQDRRMPSHIGAPNNVSPSINRQQPQQLHAQGPVAHQPQQPYNMMAPAYEPRQGVPHVQYGGVLPPPPISAQVPHMPPPPPPVPGPQQVPVAHPAPYAAHPQQPQHTRLQVPAQAQPAVPVIPPAQPAVQMPPQYGIVQQQAPQQPPIMMPLTPPAVMAPSQVEHAVASVESTTVQGTSSQEAESSIMLQEPVCEAQPQPQESTVASVEYAAGPELDATSAQSPSDASPEQQQQQQHKSGTAPAGLASQQGPGTKSWSAIAAKERSTGDVSPSRSAAGSASTSQAGQQQAQLQAQPQQAGPATQTQAQIQQLQSQQQQGAWSKRLQTNMPAPAAAPLQPPVTMPRKAGTNPVGNFLAVQPSPVSGSLRVTDAGSVEYQEQGRPQRHLQLIRGLRNGEGEYNCFLNVIIQSLWHLRAFREALLHLPAAHTEENTSPDGQVLAALSSIFRAMNAGPGDTQQGTAAAGNSVSQETAIICRQGSGNGSNGGAVGRTVSPAALRNALAALGQSAVRVEMSDMHDAAEVLGQILECLHRALRGDDSPQHDITLPQVFKASAPQAGRAPDPETIVHDLFGLDIQEPCPAPDPAEDSSSSSAGGNKKNMRSQRSSSQLTGLHGTGPSSGGGDRTALDHVRQFTKLHHLVIAQELRQAYADNLQPSGGLACKWEELLAALNCSAGAQPGDAAKMASCVLLRRPRVFTLAMVWESPQVPPEAIRSTLSAMGETLELPAVFAIPSTAAGDWPEGSSSQYTLRTVVCYFGHHYLAFVLSDELDKWLCFDDAAISLVGRWPDVCRTMLARRMQPSLFIYEDMN